MGNVTRIRATRRIDNPDTQLGRVYLVLRDASYWLQLHEIGEAILSRFGKMDSHAAISARIRQLRNDFGQEIYRREKKGAGNTRPCEYRLLPGWDGEDAA